MTEIEQLINGVVKALLENAGPSVTRLSVLRDIREAANSLAVDESDLERKRITDELAKLKSETAAAEARLAAIAGAVTPKRKPRSDKGTKREKAEAK